MTDAPSIVVDPYLVILPDPCHSSDRLEAFLEGLLAWSDALTRPDVDIYISERCIAGLYEDGWYPYDGRLTPLLKQFESQIADEQTINHVVRLVFDRTPRLEERVGILDIVCDEACTIIAPDTFINRLGPNTASGLRDSLAIVGVGQEYLLTVVNGSIFAAALCVGVETNSELAIQAKVEIVEKHPACPKTISDSDFPLTVESSLAICFGHDDALQQMAVLDLWGDASSETSAVDAIRAMIAKHRRTGLPADKGEHPFRLGRHFLESAQRCGFGSRSDLATLLIDSCARIVLKMPKKPITEFRQDPRASDGALPRRTHLTKHGAGFRLMFWETPDGVIEFANVGPKAELIIHE